MAALSANPFDDLLSSHSVFVSPNAMQVGDTHTAAHRYGQHADDRYSSSQGKDLDGDQSVGSHNQDGEGTRWGGEEYPDGYVEELFVDHPEKELAHHTTMQQAHRHQQHQPQQPQQHQQQSRQQQYHSARGQQGGDDAVASPPAQLPGQGDGDTWEERRDGRAVAGSYRDGNNSFDADSSWQAPDFDRRPSSANSPEDEDDTLVRHDDAPSPTAAAAAEPGPSSASYSFEEQPVRGMAGGKEMSLDDLIAQGERQMQEAQAQAKTASARPAAGSRPNPPPATLVTGSPPGGTPADAVAPTTRRRPTTNASAESGHSTTSPRKNVFQELEPRNRGPIGSRRGPAVRHSAEMGAAASGVAGDVSGGGGDGVRSSVTSTTGGGGGWGGGRSGGSGIGGGLRTSNSAKSASFATSWSGGDPEQQLRHVSMGVVPAMAGGGEGGDLAARNEEESREERERREFFELEMELLREEDGAEREWGEEEERGRGPGRDGQEGGSFWDGERERGRREGGEGRRESLAEGLGFKPSAASNAGWVFAVRFMSAMVLAS